LKGRPGQRLGSPKKKLKKDEDAGRRETIKARQEQGAGSKRESYERSEPPENWRRLVSVSTKGFKENRQLHLGGGNRVQACDCGAKNGIRARISS